jgi:hypothetical protein
VPSPEEEDVAASDAIGGRDGRDGRDGAALSLRTPPPSSASRAARAPHAGVSSSVSPGGAEEALEEMDALHRQLFEVHVASHVVLSIPLQL